MFLLGLATWIGTSIIVEAEIFRDVREACDRLHIRVNNWATYKLRYLLQCHMCTGIWVAAIVALFVPPIASSGIVGWALTALAIKGIAHSFLVLQKWGEAATENFKSQTEAEQSFLRTHTLPENKTELTEVPSGHSDQYSKSPLALRDCPNYIEENQ
jgi:hypothetical protein